MLIILRSVFTPIVSLFLFVLGSGFFTTLLVLRMHLENASSMSIGLMSAMFYLGLVLGSFHIEKLILRVGHIRAFSAFASALAVISLMHGIYYNVPFWLLLRVIGGFATAGLFVVIESWLLVSGEMNVRGQILSIYMIAFFAAQALGQFFINITSPASLLLFAIAAMLCSLSVIPLSMTKSMQPQISEPSVLNFRRLYQLSASGVIGCLCSGMVMSVIYGLLPWYIIEKTETALHVSNFMAAVILGGMALQYPFGKLSDMTDRRVVLILLTMLTVLLSVATIMFFQDNTMTLTLMFCFGGMTFALYPVSISHACDALSAKDMVSGTQGLLLAYSIGATLGPIVAPGFIKLLGANGLFIYFISISAFLMLFFTWRCLTTPVRPPEEPFQSLLQTTPITAELDPRSDEV